MTKPQTIPILEYLAGLLFMVFVCVPIFLIFACCFLYGKSLWRRALHHDVQGRSAKAEPLLRRGLYIVEKQLGPNHPTVARGLMDHAAILRELGRETEAAEMETRARKIGPAPPGQAKRRQSRESTLG